MNVHEEIKQLLAQGQVVQSCALGRVGQIISVDEHPLFPVHLVGPGKYGKEAVTTFLKGDKVKIKRFGSIYKVVNV